VAAAHGLDASGYSFAYVAGWAGGDLTRVRQAAETVTKAARTILGRCSADTATGSGDLADTASPRDGPAPSWVPAHLHQQSPSSPAHDRRSPSSSCPPDRPTRAGRSWGSRWLRPRPRQPPSRSTDTVSPAPCPSGDIRHLRARLGERRERDDAQVEELPERAAGAPRATPSGQEHRERLAELLARAGELTAAG